MAHTRKEFTGWWARIEWWPKLDINGNLSVVFVTKVVYEVERRNGDEEGWRSPSVAYDIVCVAYPVETLILSRIQCS